MSIALPLLSPLSFLIPSGACAGGSGQGSPQTLRPVRPLSSVLASFGVARCHSVFQKTNLPSHRHPYHPQKTLEHRWEGAPGGQVHITRTTVLALSGWSNTQFAYWARRSEAVSVLARHDHRLRDLACVLYQRLYNRHLPADAFTPSSPGSSHVPSSSSSSSSSSESSGSSLSGSPTQSLATFDADDPERQLQVAKLFTGKGLDGTIANVKKRTGASQFLRGRQSSLDAFGSNFDCQSPPCSIVDLSIGSCSRQSLGGASPFTFMSPRPLSRREELDSWSLRASATSPLPTPAFTFSTWSTRTSDTAGSGSSSPAPAPTHQPGGALEPGQEYWLRPVTTCQKRKYRPSEDIDDFLPPHVDHHDHDRTVLTEPAFKRMKFEHPPPPHAAGPDLYYH